MHLLHRTIPLILAFALASCGGSTPPPNDPNGATDSDKTPGGGSAASSSSAATEEEHKAFLTSCMETPEMKDFCSCSWDSITKTTTAEERKDLENAKTKTALAALPEQCGSKLPKATIKDNFTKACAKSPAMVPFCECSYHFLDGKGVLTSGPEAVAKVKDEMKAACSKEAYEAVYVKGCSENHPEPVCQCVFTALNKKYGNGKITLQAFLETGTDEVKKAVKSAATTCEGK